MNVLVTGSSGLIGSEAVTHYDHAGHLVFGIDNNMRLTFFGPQGDTSWNLKRLQSTTKSFTHFNIDIRDRAPLFDIFKTHRFDKIIHCAAQPSHDKAKDLPLIDFEVNALGTVNLLEATRLYCPEAVFILMSTNKVYGDSPNELPLTELPTRWEYARPQDSHGIAEDCRIDRTLHSVFGASKTAGDVMAQEYGKYFNLKVGIFRGGCLTGPNHSGVALHGFLSYLVKLAVADQTYKVLGYKGKQVRDQIHSADVIAAFEAFAKNPRPGEVYNLGGGKSNSASILECFTMLESILGRKVKFEYLDQNRLGDHICYYSDLRKLKSHFPQWTITRTLPNILEEIVQKEKDV